MTSAVSLHRAARPAPPSGSHPGFAAFAWGVVVYNLAVIVWGVFVRATGSGAGCGGHWPLCNGAIVPQSPAMQTMIEFTHRVSSALDLLLVSGLAVGAWRLFGPRHPVRRAAMLALALTLTEALIGAALVIFGWVDTNASGARVAALAVHLTNTLLLVAAVALTAWWAGGAPRLTAAGRRGRFWLLNLAGAGVLLTAILGTVAALGDMLVPAASLSAGLHQDVAASASLLVRLRVLHPVFALAVGLLLMVLVSQRLEQRAGSPYRLGIWLAAAVLLQWTAGVVDLVLLAPVWMQLVHVLCADLVWIAFVLFTASALAVPSAHAAAG